MSTLGNIAGMIMLLSLAIPGYFFNSIIFGKDREKESLSLSWLSGSAIYTLSLFVLYKYLNIDVSNQASLILFAVISVSLVIVSIKKVSFNFRIPFPVIALVSLLLISSIFFPVVDWDALILFDFRAKLLVDGTNINQVISMFPFRNYPMYTSLLHYWTYLNRLWTAMPIYPLFWLSLFLGSYTALTRVTSNRYAMFTSIAIALTPRIFSSAFVAYTNLPYSTFLIIGAIYIFIWLIKREKKNLVVGILFSLLTLWVRVFPFAFINIGLILLSVPFIKKFSKQISALSLFLIAFLYLLPETHQIANFIKWAVVEYYSPFWIIFVILFIYSLLAKRVNWFWMLAYTGYLLATILGTYYFSCQSSYNYLSIPDAVQRMTMFINAPIVLWGMEIARSLCSNSKKQTILTNSV